MSKNRSNNERIKKSCFLFGFPFFQCIARALFRNNRQSKFKKSGRLVKSLYRPYYELSNFKYLNISIIIYGGKIIRRRKDDENVKLKIE